MVEAEFKYMLIKEEYEKTLQRMSKKFAPKTFLQVNYYYDSEGLDLHKHNITFRVRQKEHGLQAQVKIPVEDEGRLCKQKEIEKSIYELPKSINLEESEWKEILPHIGKICIVGNTVTQRTTYKINDFITVDLDKNYYLGITDYELEVEFMGESKEEAQQLLKDIVGELRPNTGKPMGKRSRFFVALIGNKY